jgi:hypothetical protein
MPKSEATFTPTAVFTMRRLLIATAVMWVVVAILAVTVLAVLLPPVDRQAIAAANPVLILEPKAPADFANNRVAVRERDLIRLVGYDVKNAAAILGTPDITSNDAPTQVFDSGGDFYQDMMANSLAGNSFTGTMVWENVAGSSKRAYVRVHKNIIVRAYFN